MIVALDSNVLLYWLQLVREPEDVDKVAQALAIMPQIARAARIALPGQVLGEAHNVLTRAGRKRAEVRMLLDSAVITFDVVTPTVDAYSAGLDLAVRHKLQIWDALIISIARESGCALLLSEDMQDGFTVGGLTVANPFASTVHPRLAALL